MHHLRERLSQMSHHSSAGSGTLSASLEDALPLMSTGDVLLQIGDSAPFCRVNRALQFPYSNFTHVVMIVKDPPADLVRRYEEVMPEQPKVPQKLDTGDLYVVETMPPNGTLLRPLWYWFGEKAIHATTRQQNFPVMWRPLSNPQKPAPARVADYDGLLPVLEQAAGVAYEKKLHQFVLGRLAKETRDDHSSLFCSELVAWALREMGLLPSTCVTANFMPGQFSDEHGDYVNEKLRWGPAQYAPLVHVEYQETDFSHLHRAHHHKLSHGEHHTEPLRQRVSLDPTSPCRTLPSAAVQRSWTPT